MALTPCTDLSAAQWLTAADPENLITLGPPGFAAYARLRFLPDPAYEGQSENDAELDDDAPEESTQIAAVLRVLARHTSTPDDCYFCLWDGWRWEVRGETGAWTLHQDLLRTYPADSIGPDDFPPVSDPPPAGWAPVPAVVPSSGASSASGQAPKVVVPLRELYPEIVPLREYYLFRGAVPDFGTWGLPLTGSGRDAGVPDPAFIWPADHAWCVAHDVDPHYAGIGAAASAIEELLAEPLLDVVPADPDAVQPAYR